DATVGRANKRKGGRANGARPAVARAASEGGSLLRPTHQPVARGALGGGNLALGKFRGNLDPQRVRLFVAVHGREVEPLVRRDEVGGARAGRAHHAEVEKFPRGGGIARRRSSADNRLITYH